MIIDFEVDPEQIRKIKSLIESGKYSDLDQFLQTAISNLIKREFQRQNEPFHTKILSYQYSDTSEKSQNMEKPIFENSFDLSEISTNFSTYETNSEISDFQSELMISNFITRFFPIKLIMTIIASYLLEQNKNWFKLEEVESLVYDISEFYAKKIKKYEDEKGLIRPEKLSTGLPLPKSTKQGKRGRAITRIELKISSSRERFLNHYLGQSGKKFVEMKDGKEFNMIDFKPGICMLMGLIGYKRDVNSNELILGITEVGKQFILLENPIIRNNSMQAFAKHESQFIMTKIIPRFKLEILIIETILEKLSKTNLLETNVLDEIIDSVKSSYYKNNPSKKSIHGFETISQIKNLKVCPKCNSKKIEFDEKRQELICYFNQCNHIVKNPNIADRVAIMGRLTEMGLVEWVIGSRGKSTYKFINS